VGVLLHGSMCAAQTISAYAGSGTAGFNSDSPTFTALTSQLNNPSGLAVDASGNLYIADTGNHRLRKVTTGNAISTLLGTGASGPALTQLASPTSVAVDQASGDVYIADTNNHRILRLAGGVPPATLFAGTGSPGLGASGIAANTSALSLPADVAVDAAGVVYIADTNNHRIRKVTGGIVSDVVGVGGSFACSATRLSSPQGIALAGGGQVYIADTSNSRVMHYPGSGVSMTIAAGQLSATTCLIGSGVTQLNQPTKVAFTQLGDILVADTGNSRIKRIRAGVMTAVVGTGTGGTTGDNGSPTAALINLPQGVTTGPPDSHVYYVADSLSHRVRKVVPQAPSVPTLNSVTNAGATSLSVAFTPVATLDAPATSFTVTCVPGPSPFIQSGTSSPIVMTGLTPGQTYACTVYAQNGAGASAPTAPLQGTPGTAPGITSSAAPGGTFGVTYSHTYTSTGAPAPTFTLTSGALPPGLNLAAGGALAGTPTAAGTFTGVVTAANTVAPNATQAFSITIAKATQAIAFATLPDRIIGSGPFGLSATGGGSGNAVTFTSLTTSTCTATGTNGATLTLIATGTCTIASDQAATANYDAAPQATRSFTVQAKIAQAISFAALVDRLVNSGPANLSATGGASGNAVTFSSLTPSVCTTVGTNGITLTLVAVGTCTIAADQAGNATYDPAPQVTRSFAVQQPGHLVNISTRMQVLTGNDVMIGGFVIGGPGNKTVAIVATGPSLAAFGIANHLVNPMLTLVKQSGQQVIASNDDWQSAANSAQLTAAGFAPSNPLEAALLVNLEPGAYTAIVQGYAGGTGVSVIGVYEVDGPSIPLINISTRGRVQTGNDVMIGGFVIDGASPQTVAIVATGPSLANFGITEPLANPTLTLVRSSDQTVIASNDDWQSHANASLLQAAGFAPSNMFESGIYITLPPGAYTAILQGVSGGTGVGVIGVYRVQ
jgi:hypothetical protein